jgi:hypothetical protein
MGIETTGIVYRIGETQKVTERFSKREFIVELADNPKYPQHVTFQCTGDRCELLNGLNEGDQVRIEFSLRGRLYTSKKTGKEECFNSLDAWKVDRVGAAKSAGNVAPSGGPVAEDDIPF